MKNSLWLLLLYFIFLTPILAQNDTIRKKKNFFQRMDSIQEWKLQQGRSTLTPYLAPSYTPEMQLMISVGGLYTFTMQKDNPSLSRSSIPFSFAYSTNNSIQASARPTIYGKNDKWRLAAEYWHKKMPDNYWGVGYEKGRYTPKSDSTTGYQRNWVQLKFKFNYRIWRDLFLGINYDYNQTRATDVSDYMANDPNYMKNGSEIFNSGFGGVLRWDSRDFPENAYDGFLFELSGTGYGKFTTGNLVFQVIEFDYRQYQTIVREGSTLAWQIKTRYAGGDVPWTDLSMVGTPYDLRGYTWGQYRDHTMVFALAEYRHMFKRGKPNFRGGYYGPFGFVAWLGTGSIAHDYGTLNDWLPNGGVGFRFEIQERMNLRIDYGIGVESSAFYISFNEAF
jgi:hypothetical protein